MKVKNEPNMQTVRDPNTGELTTNPGEIEERIAFSGTTLTPEEPKKLKDTLTDPEETIHA